MLITVLEEVRAQTLAAQREASAARDEAKAAYVHLEEMREEFRGVYAQKFERLTEIGVVVNRMNRELFGDGQIGEIALLKTRVTAVERWTWRATGALGLVIVVVNLLLRLMMGK